MEPNILPERLLKRGPTRNSENAKNVQPSYVFARKLLPTWPQHRSQEAPRHDWKTVSSARRETDPKMLRVGPNLGPTWANLVSRKPPTGAILENRDPIWGPKSVQDGAPSDIPSKSGNRALAAANALSQARPNILQLPSGLSILCFSGA